MPIIGLSLIVALGTMLGLWMVLTAVGPVEGSAEASSAHGQSTDSTTVPRDATAHAHDGAVPMPGLAAGDSASDAHAMAGMAGMAGMEGMPLVDPVAPPSSASAGSADPMAAMSADEMSAMGHTADATSSPDVAGDSGRPVGATLAGFTLVNLTVLVGALIIGRRKAHRTSGPRRGSAPTRRVNTSEGAPSTTPSIESVGSPS